MATRTGKKGGASLSALPTPTPWPGANARLLGLGVGLPVPPLVRLSQFSAADFERFTLEWAGDYLAKQTSVFEVQLRGGAGDKGRDVVVWLDGPTVKRRRWHLYQCKHYDANLGLPKAGIEVAKVLYYTHIGDYSAPSLYYFVTHKGLTSNLQDLIDEPEKFRQAILDSWDRYADAITSKQTIKLTDGLREHIEKFDFGIFRGKQPLELLSEHAQTRYHLTVFGAPIITRLTPPTPPSAVDAKEARYIEQLYQVIGTELGVPVSDAADFVSSAYHSRIFKHSRQTFYSSEGLKELARDQMADQQFFDSLLEEFSHGLLYVYTKPQGSPLERLLSTVAAAQSFQLSSHPLAPHVTGKDREGMCHQMANEDLLNWCNP